MRRGRRGDTPSLQEAKGFPSRRKSKVQKAIEQADRLAAMLAEAPAEGGDDKFPAPVFLSDPRLAVAQRIWREYGPELNRTHRLGDLHRLHFAMFCVYMGEWITASEDIREKGLYQTVGTVAGGKMERTRPVVAIREIAYRNAMDMAREFGLTPREEYALFREQADAVGRNPGLFGGDRGRGQGQQPAPAAGDDETAKAPAHASVIGSLDLLDSPPPGARPN